ncbi:MmgE/PrpD family protein [Pseudorhodoferax sp.]|uniref:MmgE/PrpD family protein n=1 Tax=Pseudorhodoferax sp. TaxID=1993553 RepID=UPI0039E645C6
MPAASASGTAPSSERSDLAVDLARFAAGLQAAQLDARVVAAVKTNILDTLACALAGSSAAAIGEVASLVQEWGGAPQAGLLAFGGRYPAHHAAWANAAMAHARDFDDTHDAAILHAGITAVPAALAAAQLRGGLPGDELVASVAAGLEVTCRLGTAIRMDVMRSGFIYTALLGYFGATAAAGRALGLPQAQLRDALGIVYSAVAGNLQVTREASLMKRVLPGMAAQAALVAVQMARKGIHGVQGVFEGDYGFFPLYLRGEAHADAAREDLGRRFELLNLSYKPYASCRNTHSAVDAVLQLRAQAGDGAEVEAVHVGVNQSGYQMVCVPEAVRASPRTVVDAQFSIPYCVAAAWIDGGLRLGHFGPEALQRDEVRALAARVRPHVDEAIERGWGRSITPAHVVLVLRDGRRLEARVDLPRGHPENPMSAAEFAAKAADCASLAVRPLAADTATRLAAAVEGLESLPDVSALVRLLQP